MQKYLFVLGLFIFSFIIVLIFNHDRNYIKVGEVYINEIVSSNGRILMDKDGDYSDYIEIYNGYNHDINLKGYRLTDDVTNVFKWTFPDFIIKAHGYRLVYASGKNICENECHSNFKLNRDGEIIILIDNRGNTISQVKYPKLYKDRAYSYVDGKYLISAPSPLMDNIVVNNTDMEIKNVYINEYMSHNKGYNYASNGNYYDWVELYNDSDTDYDLSGYFISDNENYLTKGLIHNGLIKSKSYLLIHLTGSDNLDNGAYANIKLSDDDKKLILSSNSNIIDQVDVVKLNKNVSYGKQDGAWYYYYSPTPGRINDTKGLSKLIEESK